MLRFPHVGVPARRGQDLCHTGIAAICLFAWNPPLRRTGMRALDRPGRERLCSGLTRTGWERAIFKTGANRTEGGCAIGLRGRVGAGDIQDRREPSAGVILYRAEMKQPGAFRDEIFCGAADDINKDDINKIEKENLK